MIGRLIEWMNRLPEERARRLAWTLAGVGVIVSLIFILMFGRELRFPDEYEYYALSRGLVEEGAFHRDGEKTAFRPPGYPAILSAGARMGFDVIGLKALNALAVGASILCVFHVVRRFAGHVPALFGAAMATIYPHFHYTASTLYPQTLGSLLFLLALLCLWDSRGRPALVLPAGLAYGVLVLMIPSFLLKLGLVMPLLLTLRLISVRRASVFVLIVVLCLAPWTIRNYFVFDHLIPVSTNSGVNLLLGNSGNTTPNAGVTVDISQYIDAAENLDEVERDAFYREAALAWMAGHPVDAAKLYALKTLNYFNFYNVLYLDRVQTLATVTASFVFYYSFLGLLFVGLFMRRGKLSREEVFLIALYIGNALVDAIFFTRIRFRIPFDWIMIAAAAPMAYALVQRWRMRREARASGVE